MEPIVERKQPNINGVAVDLPKLRERLKTVSNWLIGAKAHCRRTQRVSLKHNSMGVEVARNGESIDWSRSYELKAEATALCMLRAALRGKVHAADIDKRHYSTPALREVVKFATGGKPFAIPSKKRDEYVALVIERMAEKYQLSSPLSRASSAA